MPFIKNNPTNDPKALHKEAAGLQALAELINRLDLDIHTPEIFGC
jgi:hypothetical protein